MAAPLMLKCPRCWKKLGKRVWCRALRVWRLRSKSMGKYTSIDIIEGKVRCTGRGCGYEFWSVHPNAARGNEIEGQRQTRTRA